jgi:hypothetical protein
MKRRAAAPVDEKTKPPEPICAAVPSPVPKGWNLMPGLPWPALPDDADGVADGTSPPGMAYQ